MKKTLAILTLLIFSFNLLGFFIAFELMRKSTKAEIRALAASESYRKQLVVFKLHKNEVETKLEWLDEKEFRFDGSMFDVVEKLIVHDSIIFKCINDKAEKKLFGILSEHIKTQSDPLLPHRKNTAQVIQNIIKEAIPETIQPKKIFAKDFKFALFCSIYKSEFVSEIIPPPPKACPV